MLQEPICRMSTISAIFKGFAASIVAGISVIAYSDIDIWVLGLSFLPLLSIQQETLLKNPLPYFYFLLLSINLEMYSPPS